MQFARSVAIPSGEAVSLSDALRLALPRGTRVTAGQQYLHQQISWAHAFVTRPWAIGSIERGALVILSLRGVTARSELLGLPRLVDALAASGVSAIALSDDVPEVSEAARQHEGLSVLVLPPDTSLNEVERAVIGLILDRDGLVQRRSGDLYQTLIGLALEDAPTQTIVNALANAAGRVVYLEDEYGVCQAVGAPDDHETLGLPSASDAAGLYSAREVLGISFASPATAGHTPSCIRRILPELPYAVCSAPITLGGTIAGFLTLLGASHQMQDIDEVIVVRAASAFAVPIAKQRAIVETQTRLQGSFLENLFAGTIADDEELAARARYLGHDLFEPYDTACLTLDDNLVGGRTAVDEATRAGAWTSFLDLARRDILERWPRALLRERGDILAVLLPAADGPTAAAIRTYLDEARSRLGPLAGKVTATVGLGRRTSGPRDIVKSYAEAEQAARIGRQFLGGDRTVSFEELGVYRVIARVEDHASLDAFCREYLGPVEEYDARHTAELIETLEGFFACNGNHARAAEMLHLHRNTLLYRLERIETLTERNLADAETRLSIQLALKIRRVLPTILASQPRSSGGGRH
ncbi:MAG: putative transcriptional regulator [Chloroflexi bacterium]|nr:putative transcriptional regulator [Chloroflexota bacterium]